MNQKGFIRISLAVSILISTFIFFVVIDATVFILQKQGKLTPLLNNISQIFKRTEKEMIASQSTDKQTQQIMAELERRIKELEENREKPQKQEFPSIPSGEQETIAYLKEKISSLQNQFSLLAQQFIQANKTGTSLFQDIKAFQGHLKDTNELIKEMEQTGINDIVEKQVLDIIKSAEEAIVEYSRTLQGQSTMEVVESYKKYIVQVVCYDEYSNASVGSGILYGGVLNQYSIVLTNYHITQDADHTAQYPCAVFYSSDPTKVFTEFYFAEPVYYPSVVDLTTMKLIDFNFLKIIAKFRLLNGGGIEVIPNASLSINNVVVPTPCREDEIRVGEEVVVLGYPAIGGQYLTATEGIISGYGENYYLVTSAKIEQGNSGGGAFMKSTKCLVGMPTFSILGKIESLARLINIPLLEKNYLSKIWKYK